MRTLTIEVPAYPRIDLFKSRPCIETDGKTVQQVLAELTEILCAARGDDDHSFVTTWYLPRSPVGDYTDQICRPDDPWPIATCITPPEDHGRRRLACYYARGSSEGHYVEIDVIQANHPQRRSFHVCSEKFWSRQEAIEAAGLAAQVLDAWS